MSKRSEVLEQFHGGLKNLELQTKRRMGLWGDLKENEEQTLLLGEIENELKQLENKENLKADNNTEFKEENQDTKESQPNDLFSLPLPTQTTINGIKEFVEEPVIETEEKEIPQNEPIQEKKERIFKNFFSRIGFDKSIASTMLFEEVRDASVIYHLEKKLGDYIFYVACFFCGTTALLIILLIVLLPLKEKEPYLVQFSNNKENFALVQKADSTITANKALIRSLVGAYVLNRESITHIEQHEKMRQNTIKEQSSNEVWYEFEKLIAHYDSIYTNPLLTRKVKIANIYLNKDLAYIDIEVSLYHSGELESLKRYKVVMSFEFKKQEINFDSMSLNPTGFIVTGYDVTEIAILKDLDERNKVKDDGVKSRIIHTEKKDPHMSQYKDVKEQ
ncbi:type IV secretion system protein [Helicobacter pylori]|uniref:VirB8 family protein n=3 Tax=Helicobacter pylori TaxID=210 RepID=A0AB74KL87_HELPX|nr:VirB8/TrbF family protein [Helicobacter pylori]TLR80733.1 virB8 family protein [Helicobacter pylori]